MSHRKPHNLVYSTDPKTGLVSVGVLLSNRDRRAWVLEEDYARIFAEFGETPWFLNDNGQGLEYVRLGNPAQQNLHMLARLVIGERPGKVIKYFDGDRCNLRATNLMVASGHGGAKHKPKAPFVDEFASELAA